MAFRDWVQDDAVDSGFVSSANLAFSSPVTGGNSIIVALRVGSTTETVSLSDDQGNTYVEDASQAQTTDGGKLHVFSAHNVTGGTVTVSVSKSGTGSLRWNIHEYEGDLVVDKTAGAEGASTTPSAGPTATTTDATELIFGACYLANGATFTAGSGFTARTINSSSKVRAEDKQVSATGTYSADFSLSSSDNWAMIVATYKAPGGGGATAALSGSAATGSAGTLAPSTSKALAGEAGTGSAGTLSPALSLALSGQEMTGAQGSLANALSVALSGSAITSAQGNVTASQGKFVALTGEAATFASGALSPGASLALSGEHMTAGQGSISVPGIVVVTESPTGGWAFLNAYEAELQRRRAAERKRKELAQEVDDIQDGLDRNIAQLLHEQEAIDARRGDLQRLGELARVQANIQAAREYSERVAKAYERAIVKGTYSALEALDRELARAREEEEFLLLSMVILND